MEQAQTKPIWTIVKILDWTKQYFADKGIENPRLDAEVLLCAVLKCQRITLYVHFDQPLEEEELARYRQYVTRRGKYEPLAYILGEREFMTHTFKVTPATLVPRPETELLVESVVEIVQISAQTQGQDSTESTEELRILDLGTGSGAIIISILDLLPAAVGTAVDISAEALAVAADNAERLGVAARFTPILSDLYSKLEPQRQFKIIVSNPPYIPTKDLSRLAKDVQLEPQSALDGGQDGLDFYRAIVASAPKYLAEGGLLAFEVGIAEAQAVATLCHEQGFTITAIRKDYAGIERMVFATKEGSGYADAVMAIAAK